MGAMILLIIIVALAAWYFTSPPILRPVGDKYASQPAYSNRGTWTVAENISNGMIYLAISLANQTYPRTTLPTEYSLVISIQNQTITSSYVRGFGVRVTSVSVQDNYDGSSSRWGIGSSPGPPDAVTAIGSFNFQTSADHKLRFTLIFQLYVLLPLGYLPDKTVTASFNTTQTVL
jgi:hypothetical protein